MLIIIDSNIIHCDYICNDFDIDNIKGLVIKDTADNGQMYNKTIRYMDNKTTVDNNLIQLVLEEKNYVGKVINYIINHLRYGTNVIILKGTEISKCENIYPSDVSKGISRLIKLNIIIRIKDIDKYKDCKNISNNMFVVNHNFIFRGNIKQLIKDFEEQKQQIR